MTDEDQARGALAEVARRQDETTRLATRAGTPVWFVAAVVVVLLVQALVSDLRFQEPSWNGWFTRWAVPAISLLVLAGCAVIAHRRASVTLHRSRYNELAGLAVGGFLAFYLCQMAIGIPMRYARLPFDQTVSLVGAFLLLAAGWLAWRRIRARRG